MHFSELKNLEVFSLITNQMAIFYVMCFDTDTEQIGGVSLAYRSPMLLVSSHTCICS